MDRRIFFALSATASAGGLFFAKPLFPRLLADVGQPKTDGDARQAVLVHAGFTRKSDGTSEQVRSSSGMFDTQVVRSSDSDGRLAVFLFPVADHQPYAGAPLHMHHEQDEWIYILAGEFVAEVDGKRMRLRAGDSLLMPMKVPHRWSVAQTQQCGAIHLYSPAGLMEMDWSGVARDPDANKLEARKAEFERHGLALLGAPLTKQEIDNTES
jgi:mannose-6-phosphate isomerase-like protein (cupin superfamily)